MLDKLMQVSLKNRLIVVITTLGILLFGSYIALKVPVDVFPDLTAPTVTVLTESHGMAPEEVETLVTFPIETVVNGASGVRRVRSKSIQGLSTVWVEFEWGTDIYKARQIVSEKLQSVQNTLPEGIDQPVLAPITSIMGEIMLVGITSESSPLMELRTAADFTLRRRLLAVPGVAQVLVYGGERKQYQIQVNPYKLRKYNITLDEIYKATAGANKNASGGFFVDSGQEYLIRGIGRINNVEELENTVIKTRKSTPILIGHVADVAIAPATKIGEASVNSNNGIILVISKQPDSNTLKLTERIESVLQDYKGVLRPDVELHTDIFRQADFIEVAVDNVATTLRDGAILVVIVLMLFLVNVRTTLISLLAIPISLIVATLVIKLLNMSFNTMTLGGMAIAIGVLVDDAIIYVENVYRRLKENADKDPRDRKPFNEVVAHASSEIRAPIAMATFIVIVVFIPLFFLSGVEGRMLKPLGLAYSVSILASLLVAVTVTPALSSYLLRKVSFEKEKDSRVIRALKYLYLPTLRWSLNHRIPVIAISVVLFVIALVILPFLGRSFLPEFNEGTLNISVATVPGTSVKESDKIGKMVEDILLSNEAVVSTARRTGRTELDEHSLGSHAHELEVKIDLTNSEKEQLLEELRNELSLVPGTSITIGQPISHRIDHMLSGTRANIAVKIFGSDLYRLRNLAEMAKQQMETVEGVVDLSVEQQADVPQVRINADRQKMALYGLKVSDLDEMIDIAFLGAETSQIYRGETKFDLVVRYAPEYRDDFDAVKNSLINTPTGQTIPLSTVTNISVDKGPNYISRENVQRKITVQANVAERDIRSVVEETKLKINENIEFPKGYYVEYGGQFESEEQATRTISILSLVSIFAILVALYMEFGTIRQSLLVMVNLPLALIGGILSVYLTEGIITIASLVGFITLFGIAVRNGIIMVSHYNHLIEEEGKGITDAVIQGSLERLNPIMMTALTTGLALLPLALAGNEPGSEIQSPMSIVILGGLLTATFLNLIVIPVLFAGYGVQDDNTNSEK